VNTNPSPILGIANAIPFFMFRKAIMEIKNECSYRIKKYYLDILFKERKISFSEWYNSLLDLMEKHNIPVQR